MRFEGVFDMSQQQDVVKELNQQVANWTVAYTKLHNFHWYVKGPNFFFTHKIRRIIQ